MKKSDFSIENYDKILDHLGNKPMHGFLPRITNRNDTKKFNPIVDISDEAKSFMIDSISIGNPLIFVPNHIHIDDHHIVNASLSKLETVHGIKDVRKHVVGNTVIWSKPGHFEENWRDMMLLAYSNVFPAWREADLDKNNGKNNAFLLGRAGLKLINLSLDHMKNGNNVLFFPEGTRNTGDPKKIQEIKNGVGELAVRAWKFNPDIAIMPIGIALNKPDGIPTKDVGEDVVKNAAVYFGDPITYRKDESEIVTGTVKASLQYWADNANQTFKLAS